MEKTTDQVMIEKWILDGLKSCTTEYEFALEKSFWHGFVYCFWTRNCGDFKTYKALRDFIDSQKMEVVIDACPECTTENGT